MSDLYIARCPYCMSTAVALAPQPSIIVTHAKTSTVETTMELYCRDCAQKFQLGEIVLWSKM